MSAQTSSPWIVEQHWDVRYQHIADAVSATFLRTLRDEGRLLGIRCPRCERVLAPPRPLCDIDFCATEGWVELGTQGTLEMFTIVSVPVAGAPEPPYVLAYVRLDGADTPLPGLLEGIELDSVDAAMASLHSGMRIDLALAVERVGRMSDVRFRLAGQS
ncbi:MAG: uncharacterized protein QOI89_2009 [Solirubrobacteraceae bacterium]|jgi:uncharacterized OB-fold protein|nr:uncharacterized protein [Solirubrobacteraceae bacterium]